MDILEIPATPVMAESSRSAWTQAGKLAWQVHEILALSDECYTRHFSAIEKGKNCDLPEDTNDEELAACVDILSTKLDLVTADATSALSMAYDCNLACVELEKLAVHGPNASLSHRVTWLEGKMNDILGKLDMFETQFSNIATILQKLSTNGPLTQNQVASGLIKAVEDNMGDDMEVEKAADLVPDRLHKAKDVDANATMQTVQSSADIGSTGSGGSGPTIMPTVEPCQQDDSVSGPNDCDHIVGVAGHGSRQISLPMVEQHGPDDSVSGTDYSDLMLRINNVQEEQ
ncbi:hypothetical protein CVT25_009307 [Psilocybe cyanescens]|uniref:Uncharacterized protein n=1 Tax=Psilocybe cyanescens TaxID=93625 RepID=A0A409XDH7_PSICY|nr:hypothetical protein CVT25_009307 [Psilocybe cyanescens]